MGFCLQIDRELGVIEYTTVVSGTEYSVRMWLRKKAIKTAIVRNQLQEKEMNFK